MEINLHRAEFIRSAAGEADFPRDSLPQIVFSGRSNVGKSSVMNRILGRKNFARVANTPGKTAFINYFLIDGKFYLVDLPGYGFARVSKAEKMRWSRLIEGYFARADQMTAGILIVDARHAPSADDQMMAEWFRHAGAPFMVLGNKADKLKKSETAASLERVREVLSLGEEVPVLLFSAQTGTGKEEALRIIGGFVKGSFGV